MNLLQDFTGIHIIYEEPVSAEIILETSRYSVDDLVMKILHYLEENEILNDRQKIISKEKLSNSIICNNSHLLKMHLNTV